MALNTEEQRILDEVERNLAAQDPGLAARMAALSPRDGWRESVRSSRSRSAALMLATVLIVTMSLTLMLYALAPLRAAGLRTPPAGARPGSRAAATVARSAPARPAQSVAGSRQLIVDR